MVEVEMSGPPRPSAASGRLEEDNLHGSFGSQGLGLLAAEATTASTGTSSRASAAPGQSRQTNLEIPRPSSADSRDSMFNRRSGAMDRKKSLKKDNREHAFSVHHLASKGVDKRPDCVRRFVSSTPWLLLQIAAIFADIVIAIFWDKTWNTLMVQMVIYVMFLVDIFLRIFAFGPHLFFQKTRNVFDAFIVFFSIGVSVVVRVHDPTRARKWHLAQVVILGRLLRVIRVTRMLSKVAARACLCMRYLTGSDKARFVDPANDIDLDLVYITDNLIGMSVPAKGWIRSLYRNPLSEVVYFFEIYHPCCYMIINICPEIHYADSDFPNGTIWRLDVQDHTPPTVTQFVQFLAEAEAWMSLSSDNVLAIHCRGGKGRTGSLCAAWMLYRREQESAEAANLHFATQRTDIDHRTGERSERLQGVETPSQVRYIDYVHRMLRDQQAYSPKLPVMPQPVELRLDTLTCRDFMAKPVSGKLEDADNNEDLIVAVHRGGEIVYWSQPNAGVWDLNGTIVEGDVRISVAKRSASQKGAKKWDAEARTIAGKEPGCLFYFLFHTAFAEGEQLALPPECVDKASKKTKLYPPGGMLILDFKRQGAHMA